MAEEKYTMMLTEEEAVCIRYMRAQHDYCEVTFIIVDGKVRRTKTLATDIIEKLKEDYPAAGKPATNGNGLANGHGIGNTVE